MLIDLMTLDICGMATDTLVHRAAGCAQIIQHVISSNVHDCIDCHRVHNNVAPVYCRIALDHCKHTCQMTPARSTTLSASLRVTIEQISTIIRSIIIHHSVIRCNVHVCIGYKGHAIMFRHYIA